MAFSKAAVRSLALFAGVSAAYAIQLNMFSRDHVLKVAREDLAKDLKGNLYIVTGSNSGVGLETTRQLVKQGAHVVMAVRRPEAADEAAEDFTGPGTHESIRCDLSDLSSVREFCSTFKDKHNKLTGLVCNAGMVNLNGPMKTTKDGIETTIGISYFGHFLMTELLLDLLKKTPDARHVILSSVVHAGDKNNRYAVNLDDLTFEKREFSNFQAYGEGKVACCLYAVELADRLKNDDVTCGSVHPGWARSNFGSGGPWYMSLMLGAMQPFIRFMTDSSEEASQTSLHVLLNDGARKHSGEYFSQHSYLYSDKECRKGGWPMKSPNPNARDHAKAKELVEVSRGLVGLK